MWYHVHQKQTLHLRKNEFTTKTRPLPNSVSKSRQSAQSFRSWLVDIIAKRARKHPDVELDLSIGKAEAKWMNKNSG